MPEITFQTDQTPLRLSISALIVAGWTGRDTATVQHHIDELAKLGVQPPSQVPLYYRAGAALLTQEPEISVLGPATSGEVEPFVVSDWEGTLWLGLASDHTDRALESLSVAKSKQICPKPLAPVLWPFASVSSYLDEILICSDIRENSCDGWTQYQRGSLSAICPLLELIEGFSRGGLAPGMSMLCGTLPTWGGIRPAREFRMTLEDPITGRAISHSYRINELPLVS